MMAPGTSSMLRARRRDVNVKPNRRLDRKSSRGMLYENEELRLRTININAEVERGQNDIKKLRRENEQLRREIWGLREEYDRLENLLGKAKGSSGQDDDDTDNGEGEEEDLEYDEEEDDEDEADLDNAENQQKASSTSSRTRRNSVRVLFDGLSVVDEETDEEATCDSANSKHKHEQQFFGKIKLPNGKEGVFMSDGMLPNSNGVQACSWPEQSYYNYTFTPVDSSERRISAAQENDGYFGTVPTGEFFQRRGGPDVFISGAYPATASPTTFPVGGNLDQLLKQMNGNENENALQIADPQVAPPEANAQEDDPKDKSESGVVYRSQTFAREVQNIKHAAEDNTKLRKERQPPTLTCTGQIQPSLESELSKGPVEHSLYCSPLDKLKTNTSVVRQRVNAQTVHSNLRPPLADFNLLWYCNNSADLSIIEPIQKQIVHSKCNKSPGVEVRIESGEIESCGAIGDESFKCGSDDVSIVNQRRSVVSTRKRRSVVTAAPATTVHRQESLCHGEESATKAMCDDRPHTLVFETGHRNLTVQEVIDALEVQLDARLEDAVKGVRVVNGNCFVCLNKEDSVEALLRTGLTIRGEQLTLEEASRGYVLVSASGVPYDVSDDALARALSQHSSVLGDIERRMYKGVDTGERVIKLKPLDAEIPPSITVSGSKIVLQILKSADEKDLGETCPKPEIPAKPMENCFATDRFRSQISVRLKQPNPKGNRSLDNIFDTSSPKQLHNTSLPIISPYDNASYVDQGKFPMTQHIGSVDNTCFQPYPRNFLKDPPSMFSELPNRKPQEQTVQLHNIMDDSAESVDMFTQPTHQFQSNPFVGSFPTSSPVTSVSVNPFIPNSTYTSQPIQQYTSPEHQRQAFHPQTTSNARLCSPCPFVNAPAQFANHVPNSGVPSPILTPQNSPQVNKTPYFPPDNFLPNPVPSTKPPNPGFLIPTSYYHGDVISNPSNLTVSNPALNITPVQQSPNIPNSQINHSSQNIVNEVSKPQDVPEPTLDRSKLQSTSMPSSPITGRRKKPSILSHQQSKSSGDEGPRSSPGAARRKISRKQSSTNSIKSHQSVDTSGGPNATSSPNTKHKTSVTHSRKTSGGISSSGEATGGSQTNVVDVSRSSSSGQDSPTKPDRRRRVSIYFNKKGAAKRRDSVFVPNGSGAPGAGILTRSISLEAAQRCTGGSTTDVATGHSAGAETTTCSDRERTNSASSRTSSATGTSRLRKHSECSNRGSSIADVGKVPWCGCWGNGCL